MSFWNGSAWVPETAPTPAVSRIRRAGAWVATLVMVGSIFLYVIPFSNTTAAPIAIEASSSY